MVTAREIFGLLHFGYRKTEQPGSKFAQFTVESAADAQNASITAYRDLMAQKEALGAQSIRSLLSGDQTLKLDIRTFDKSTLKKVTPPTR